MFIYKYAQHLMKNTEFHIMLSILMTGACLMFFGVNITFLLLGADDRPQGRTAYLIERLVEVHLLIYPAILFVWFWIFHMTLCIMVNMTKWFGARTLFIAAAIGLLLAVGLVALTVWIFNFAGR